MHLKAPKQQKSNLDPLEEERLIRMTFHEREAWKQGYRLVAGVDEAGRGPLAGPVVAAACIIPEELLLEGVDDSKKLTPRKRSELFERYTKDPSIHYGVGIVHALEIDKINIYQATIKAMGQAIAKLPVEPTMLLVDGLQLPHAYLPAKKLIKGDSLSQSIALASIIAKETRDSMMLKYHQQWPQYDFDKHKGYGTIKHRNAIEKYGRCPIHRKTFQFKTKS